MIDSPKTPATPASPVDITTLHGRSQNVTVSYKDCVDLAKKVRLCSQSLIEGEWVEENTVRGKGSIFIPSNFESAKSFLRASVESLERSYRSPPDTPSKDQVSSPTMPTCHGCHGPMGQGQHMGSAPGKLVCTLAHSPYCRGGIIEDVSWKPCPQGYSYDKNLDLANGPGFESTMNTLDFHHPGTAQTCPTYSTPVTAYSMPPRPPHLTGARVRVLDRFPSRFNGQESAAAPGGSILDTSSAQYGGGETRVSTAQQVDGATALQREEGSNNQQGFHTLPEDIQVEINRHRAQNQVETQMNSRPAGPGPDIGALRRDRDLQQGVEEVIENFIRPNIPSLSAARTASILNPDVPLQSAARHRGIILPTENPATVRQQPVIVSAEQVQQGYGGQQHQQNNPRPYQGSGSTRSPQYCYEWVNDGKGSKVLLRTLVEQPVHQALLHHQQTQYSQQTVSPQPRSMQLSPQHVQEYYTPAANTSQPLGFQPQPDKPVDYRVEHRYSPTTGRVWQVKIPIAGTTPAPTAPQFRWEWRIDPITGETFQVKVSLTPSNQESANHCQQPVLQEQAHVRPQHHHEHPQNNVHVHQAQVKQSSIHNTAYQASRQPDYLPPQQHQVPTVHTRDGQHPGPQGGVSVSGNVTNMVQPYSHYPLAEPDQSKHEKVAGIVSLLEGGNTRKYPNVIEFAKKCPIRWSKQATMTNINLPLYVWGAVSELESSLSGRTEAMSENMLLGKLRHLQNTMEVCCLGSSATDFTGYGWTLARDYATKVDNEVDQRLATWQGMEAGVRTATLLSAQMEHPRPLVTRDPKKPGIGDKKDTCQTYNKCKTEGKCEYEVKHPDKTCQRKHECSYCREKKGQSWRHQVWNCKSKPTES